MGNLDHSESKEIVEIAAKAAADKQATDIVIIEISKILIITDYFLIASGNSNRQVQTISDNIADKLKEHKVRKVGIEGDKQGTWILMDYGSVIIHIFTEEQREYYQLERLWADAPSRRWAEE